MSQTIINIEERPPLSHALPLALQHVFAMFGATVLVPFLTGLDPSVAILTSGIGTLIFHFFTRGMVPAYLGSSFAFIASLAFFVKDQNSVALAMGGAFTAGLVYVVVYFLIKAFGTGFIHRLVPSVVVGPVVMIIGLSLAGVAVKDMASQHWPTAIFTLLMAIIFSVFAKGFFKIIPILLGILAGYGFAIYQGLVDFTKISSAPWLQNPVSIFLKNLAALPSLDMPFFTMTTAAIITIAPIAFVTIIEDLGHIFVLSNVTERDMIEKPGFDRVLLGNGIATAVAALFGGPPSTTYGENIGVLAITKVYSAWVIRIAALFAIGLSFIGKLGAAISTIPVPVMGGICILLFGMIAAAGMRTMIEEKTDLSSTRNLIIVSIILILGIGTGKVGLATLAGIMLNLILPLEDRGLVPQPAKKKFPGKE